MFLLFYSLCCKRKQKILTESDFLQYCKEGNLQMVKFCVDNYTFDLTKGLVESVITGQLETVKLLVENESVDINKCLAIASKKNDYYICQYLLEKGGNPDIVLRFSNSPNIFKMVYRYKQKSEIIN